MVTDTKERLLRASSRLFRAQGFAGTGLKQVAAEADAPWGSLYHFFPQGKEQLGAEAVRHAGERDKEAIRALFERVEDPVTAVRRMFEHEMHRLQKCDYAEGCPAGTVASDVAVSCDRVREACSDVFHAWETTMAQAFAAAGAGKAEARCMASFVLSALEGATLLSRTHRSPKPFREAVKMVEHALRAVLPDRQSE
jgi:TetR/AcrR family transcriptional repressor of lmrAB and yxaGH operons